jgi:hypothetical protein
MLSVANKPIMLSVIMLNVVVLNVMAPCLTTPPVTEGMIVSYRRLQVLQPTAEAEEDEVRVRRSGSGWTRIGSLRLRPLGGPGWRER